MKGVWLLRMGKSCSKWVANHILEYLIITEFEFLEEVSCARNEKSSKLRTFY